MLTLERELLAAINAVRARRGLRPLRPAPRLRAAAVAHSMEMAKLGYFEHASADGTAFWRRIVRFYPARGYRSWWVGENIASGSPSLGPQETLADWMRSPAHRANMLDRTWRDAGIGAVFAPAAPGSFRGLPTMVITLDMGKRRR